MESYSSLSSGSTKLNYTNNGVGASNERKMPLSRSLTQPAGTNEYVVTGSDTLASVAAKFQTTPSELARINKITGRFIFPGQILYVPKRNQGNDKGSVDVPPNTPNCDSRTSSNSDSALDSPVPGHAQRVVDTNSLFPTGHKDFHHVALHQTSSSPISTMHSVETDSSNASKDDSAKVVQSSQIDPADRDCLERFLKIGVRHITDGLGVVAGVLLVTPNAICFDPNVSDPLVIEHGTEIYGVTVPMELILKTAIYTDIAHMRVKHAPEAVPSVPKPAVYYATDGDGGSFFEENIRNAYSSKSITQFDTIASIANEPQQQQQQQSNEPDCEIVQHAEGDKMDISEAGLENNQTASKIETTEQECETNKLDDDNSSCDPQQPQEPTKEESETMEVAKDDETFEDAQESFPDKSEPNERLSSERLIEEEASIDLTENTTSEAGSFEQNKSGEFINVSIDEEKASQDTDASLGSSPQQSNRLSSYFQSKLALSERHSAPLTEKRATPPPLVTAVSAEESNDSMINKRRSAHGESRREQMLKRLSNPVDTIGNITKSGINSSINATKTGFNATKSGISLGVNATKSGISTGIMATKTGLTTGLNVTKTGFNKVLSTPKNLMNLSTSLARDAKGALATGSKSDNDLSGKTQDVSLGYTNMVDTKIDALENFDKLIPRPAKHSKDPPLYMCIRMGKHTKAIKKSHRFSPTYSFGRKKYEREYWFSVPKEKARNLYYFFQKWAPEIYGDVDDIRGCDKRGLEPINTDDELESDELEEESAANDGSGTEKSTEDNKENDSQKLNVKTKFWRRRSPLNFLKLVEDHFSTDGTEWNISNSSEEHSFAERFMLEPNEQILPDIIGQTELLTSDIILNLSKHLPARAEGYGWTLIYSTSIHGFSLNTLYREMKRYDSPVLLIIEDTNGAKFGALLSNSLQMSDHFYGTGETFLFTFFPDFACFPWTGENLFFIKGNADSISVGAGEGNFGLWLDGDLYHGSSHPCKTFGNHTLSSEEDFVVKSIECWGFV